ncbi:polysaccharide deacetylase family protein [Nonomuraea sediminis]|uniref:polysaccharide deacetylase family protein n=1 Tax=Nonomuraea sediminis TaxID=2835864 RepID=UPI001BDBC5AF|nr:polysaccharide deacetylase family protein [Nonomuraea sediminis]
MSTQVAFAAVPAPASAAVNCRHIKCLALTFDDGPGPYTSKLLDILKKRDVKATFFLEGQHVVTYADVARREHSEGHAIGNHSYTHPHLPTLSDAKIIEELMTTQDAIEKAIGIRPKLYRPPYGDTDKRVLGLAGQQGLAEILWSRSSQDWKTRDATKIIREVMRDAKRNGVILMHDVYPETIEAMPYILRMLHRRGFHLVTLPALFGDRQPQAGTSYP